MLVSSKQIQKLDKVAIEKYGVPSLALMENAGKNVAGEVFTALKGRKKVCVVCGSGNNAGDGFVAARHLLNRGCRVEILLTAGVKKLKADADANYAILKKLRMPILDARKTTQRVLNSLKRSDVVVDAIFGVGLNRDIKEPVKSLIHAVNTHAKKTVAVDTPSGLDVTTGAVLGACVKAHTTVTFTFSKTGFKRKKGPKHVGKVVVADIGIPKALYKYCR